MKAKIQFTVEIEEIPEEVRNRVEKVFYRSEKATEEVKSILGDISENNILVATQRIDKVRKELAFIDAVLEDAYSVLTGYVSYQSKQLEQTIPERQDKKDE